MLKKLKNQSVTVKVLENQTDFSGYIKLNNLNREVKNPHVQVLIESFSLYGTGSAIVRIIQTKAFTGKNQFYVVDGQHTMEAAKALGLGVTIIIVRLIEDTKLKVAQYVAVLNNSNRSWSNKVYMDVFNNDDLEIPEYKLFNLLLVEHKLTTTDLLNIFLGGAGVRENKEWKSGAMKFIDLDNSMKMLNAILKIKSVLPKLAHIRRAIYPMMRSAKNYDRFAKAILKANPDFAQHEATFYNELVDIYNDEFKRKIAK